MAEGTLTSGLTESSILCPETKMPILHYSLYRCHVFSGNYHNYVSRVETIFQATAIKSVSKLFHLKVYKVTTSWI